MQEILRLMDWNKKCRKSGDNSELSFRLLEKEVLEEIGSESD